MNLSNYIDNLALKSDDWSDYLLPSAVNESKQMVNSKVFSGVYLIGAICFLFIAIGLYFIPSTDPSGAVGFLFFSGIMDTGLIFIIPMMLYQNMTSERSNGSFELMSITSITPLKIVLGKWQSGMMQSVVFGSIVLPGLIYCYFFNGIAISAIFVCIILTLLVAQFAILLTILFCSLGILKRSRIGLQLISTIANGLMLFGIIAFKIELVNYDYILSKILTWEFFGQFLIFMIYIIIFEGFLIALSSARLSTYAANKSTLPRIFYSLLILGMAILFSLWDRYREVQGFMLTTLLIHSFISFFFLIEKDELTKKLLLEYNKKDFFLHQVFKRIFYPGKSSAYILFIIQTLTLLVGVFVFFNLNPITSPHYRDYENPILTLTAATGCFIFYISCIYLTFLLILNIFPLAKIGIMGFSGIFVILLIFLVPITAYFNDENEFWLVMNFVFILKNTELEEYNLASLTISTLVMMGTLFIAFLHNRRKEEKIRDFVAGERGST